MSNQFKSNYTSKSYNINKYNLFTTEKKTLNYNPLKSDFPELSIETPLKSKHEIESTIKFNEIVKKENNINGENINNIPQGYVSYSLGKYNKIEIKYGPNTKPLISDSLEKKEEELSPTEIMNNIIDSISKNMEYYKQQFIERNGEDEYYRIYNYQNTDINSVDEVELEYDCYMSENEYETDYY